jgi:hypothetical protein
LFSESRDTIKWGHFAQQKNNNLGPGQYGFCSFTDELKKSKNGKFGKIAQYPAVSSDRLSIVNQSLRPRNPTWPGPGAYSPIELSKVVNYNSPPFLVASGRNDYFISPVSYLFYLLNCFFFISCLVHFFSNLYLEYSRSWPI